MHARTVSPFALLFVLLATAPISAQESDGYIAHEWGTFTAVAGIDGVALDWRPLSGPSDLPSFVYSIDKPKRPGLRGFAPVGKGDIRGTVRMETPVIYFYADEQQFVRAKVGFPQGRVTEWYPRAHEVADGIDWGGFNIVPNANVELPREPGDSHYYPARNVDAAPIRVCHETGNEFEKFLFYRGVGNFDLHVAATLDEDRYVNLRHRDGGSLGRVMVFERKGDQIGFSVTDVTGSTGRVARPTLAPGLPRVLDRIRQELVRSGLYEKEAAAMVATWEDQWFEEGLRVFTILPEKRTNEILPLTLEPAPKEIVRVLVGRLEIITPEQELAILRELRQAASAPALRRADLLARMRAAHGRFLEPIVDRVLERHRVRGGEKLKRMLTSS